MEFLDIAQLHNITQQYQLQLQAAAHLPTGIPANPPQWCAAPVMVQGVAQKN